jgi:hypothetical protein
MTTCWQLGSANKETVHCRMYMTSCKVLSFALVYLLVVSVHQVSCGFMSICLLIVLCFFNHGMCCLQQLGESCKRLDMGILQDGSMFSSPKQGKRKG